MQTTVSQEKMLIQDLLYVFMSIEGSFIKRREDTANNRYYYYIDNKEGILDQSLMSMVSNILPLCDMHDRIIIFIGKYSSYEHGLVFQSLSNGVKNIRKDYIKLINMLDKEFNKGTFTLQRLWYETQKPLKSRIPSEQYTSTSARY